MTWHWTPYALVQLAIGLLPGLAGLYVLHTRHRRPAAESVGALLLFSASWWTTCHALQLAAAGRDGVMLWAKLKHVGIAALPVTWAAYILLFTGFGRYVTRRNVVLASIVPLGMVLLTFTNESHHLIWSSTEMATWQGMLALNEVWGVGFWAFLVYTYALTFSGTAALVRTLIRSRQHYQLQVTAVLSAHVLTIGCSLLDVLLRDTYGLADPTAIAVSVSGPVVAWALPRLRVGDIMPVARERVVGGMGDSVIVLDSHQRIVDTNAAAERFLGARIDRLAGREVDSLWPGLVRQDAIQDGISYEVSRTSNGVQRAYHVRCSRMVDGRDRLVGLVVVVRDITDRVRAEEENRATLRQKEQMLKEVHHRVKNNLQVVSSLLSLQSTHAGDQPAAKLVLESRGRVRAMALIHDNLYRSLDLSRVGFGGYLRDLTSDLSEERGAGSRGIRTQVDADDVDLDVDTAVPCGLIVNELVANSLQHAFPNGRSGLVRVTARARSGELHLTVEDDGVGLPADLDMHASGTLGLQLVTSLVRQIDGVLSAESNGGAAFRVVFRLEPAEPPT